MNKITIPVILVATVMVAGAFAFMPVEQATTVHTTIISNVEDQPRSITVTTDVGAVTQDNEVVVVLDAGDAFVGTAILSSAGAGACSLQDASDDVLLAGIADAVTNDVIGNDGTTAGFLDAENVELDTPANTSCYLTIVVSQWE